MCQPGMAKTECCHFLVLWKCQTSWWQSTFIFIWAFIKIEICICVCVCVYFQTLQLYYKNNRTTTKLHSQKCLFKYTFFQLTCLACLHAFCEVKFFIALPSGYFLFLPKGQTGLAGDMKPLTAENIDRFLLWLEQLQNAFILKMFSFCFVL